MRDNAANYPPQEKKLGAASLFFAFIFVEDEGNPVVIYGFT